jgi:hypothetical protein
VRSKADSFAREHWRRPYKAAQASAREALVSRFSQKEAELTARRWRKSDLGFRWHLPTTRGVRVRQVGVNPLRRAVAIVGVATTSFYRTAATPVLIKPG